MMKALIKELPESGYKLRDIPVPEVGNDEVLYKVEKVAICGSDIALYHWNEVAKAIATVPFIPGKHKNLLALLAFTLRYSG
jgi:threonine 3-dehydrogenase